MGKNKRTRDIRDGVVLCGDEATEQNTSARSKRGKLTAGEGQHYKDQKVITSVQLERGA